MKRIQVERLPWFGWRPTVFPWWGSIRIVLWAWFYITLWRKGGNT